METIIEYFVTLFARVVLWFETYPSWRAAVIGCVFAIVFTQGIKLFYPVHWSVTTVKRFSQVIAIVSGAVTTFVLWPLETPHGFLFAVMSGMCAPQVYTALKWALPNLMRRWGWSCIQLKKEEKAQEKIGG